MGGRRYGLCVIPQPGGVHKDGSPWLLHDATFSCFCETCNIDSVAIVKTMRLVPGSRTYTLSCLRCREETQDIDAKDLRLDQPSRDRLQVRDFYVVPWRHVQAGMWENEDIADAQPSWVSSRHVMCSHHKRKTNCAHCGGGSLCVHNVQRHKCRRCSGSSFCVHGTQKSECARCGGCSICRHQRVRHRCKQCQALGV